jgi:hypothetical protein
VAVRLTPRYATRTEAGMSQAATDRRVLRLECRSASEAQSCGRQRTAVDDCAQLGAHTCAACVSDSSMNSAGRTGANPTKMLTFPLSRSP